MRLFFAAFFFISSVSSAQEKVEMNAEDSLDKQPLVGNIWNGLIISATDNPAFAGFDRRFQASINYEGERLKVPEGFDTKEPAFWNQTAEIDFAFGGQRRNVGINISYTGGQQLISNYHRLQLGQSYRLNLGAHQLIGGFGLQYLHLSSGSDTQLFGDAADPRYGWVYPTREFPLPDTIQSIEYAAGLIYCWKPMFLSYSFRYQHRSLLTPAGKDFHPLHELNLSYTHDFNRMGHISFGTSVSYDSFHWYLEPFLVATWKQHLFATMSSPNLDEFKIRLGFSRWQFRVFYECSFYFSQYANDNFGVASMKGGLRYHIQSFGRKKS